MPWIHAPAFLFVRRPKNGARVEHGGREIIDVFRTSNPQFAAEKLNERKWLDDSLAERKGIPLYDYELYRLVKGGGYRGKYDAVPYPHGFEVTVEGKLRFWCLPYHHTYQVNVVADFVPQEVVEEGADAVEAYVRRRAEEAIQNTATAKTVSEEQYRHVRAVFEELEARR